MRVTGQLTDGSRGSRITKCDPLSALSSGLGGTIILVSGEVKFTRIFAWVHPQRGR